MRHISDLSDITTAELIRELSFRMEAFSTVRFSTELKEIPSEETYHLSSSLAVSILASVLPNALDVLPQTILDYKPAVMKEKNGA